MSVAAPAAPLRQWQRFSLAERIMRSVFYLIALIDHRLVAAIDRDHP
ncbi:MAG: hypothetical protein ABWY66_07690 [Xanthobacteraceae bacterium]|jgi:hypothetical protein